MFISQDENFQNQKFTNDFNVPSCDINIHLIRNPNNLIFHLTILVRTIKKSVSHEIAEERQKEVLKSVSRALLTLKNFVLKNSITCNLSYKKCSKMKTSSVSYMRA